MKILFLEIVMEKNKLKSFSFILVSLLLAAITGFNYINSQNETQQDMTSDWTYSTPEDENMDSNLIQNMIDMIEEQSLPINSVIVVKNGRIVKEEYLSQSYGSETKRKMWSATKSVTSALIGIAIQEGFMEGVDQKVLDFFPGRTVNGDKQEVTIEHLLTMTPGHQWAKGDGSGMRYSVDPVQYVLDKPMVYPPGTMYNYGDGAPFLLSAALTEATGMTTLEFAQEYLFDPLNITNVYWEGKDGQYFAASGLHLTPRDMGKLGYLFLNNGKWGEKQVVPAKWVDVSTKSHISGPGFMAERDFYVEGYGYLWWVLPESGVYYAAGMHEQRIYVCPELDLVAVFTSNNNGNDVTPGLLHKYILPACEEYVEESYVKNGISFSYPTGMSLVEAPAPGTETLSDASGFLQLRSGYPLETISVMWHPPEGNIDLEREIANLFSMVENEVTTIERVQYQDSEINGHNMVYMYANVTENGYTTSGAIGCWYCDESGRVIMYYYITDPEVFPQKEISEEFFKHLKTICCH